MSFFCFDELVDRLGLADGADPRQRPLADASFPGALPAITSLLRRWLTNLGASDRRGLIDHSCEKGTHYSWWIAGGHGSASLWLNEYKSMNEQFKSHANTVHNHRYDFHSVILTGSYEHETFSVLPAEAGGKISGCSLIDRRRVVAGEGLTMRADEFHRIPRAAANTISLVLQSPQRRGWSVSFDPEDSRTRRHEPMDERFDRLVATLAG